MVGLSALVLVTGLPVVVDAANYLDRVEKAAKEAETWGWSNFFHWGFSPGKTSDFVSPPITVFGEADTKRADGVGANVSCFRIPSIVQTGNGTLLAFAEARGRFPRGSCADCSPLGIAVKRSVDGGSTWEPFVWAVDPWFAAGKVLGNSGGNPVAVYDARRGRVLLHFVRGSRSVPGSAKPDCVPGDSNWQVTSDDDGRTWTTPRNISHFLGDYVGALPGPGNGAVQLLSSGRILFNMHYETAERPTGAVVVYYTDDGGETYALADGAVFHHMDESTMTEVGDGEVLINMRNDPNTSGNTSCHCRAVARSVDGGASWSGITFDPALNDSICEASITDMNPWGGTHANAKAALPATSGGNLTVFFNPAMQHMRSQPTLKFSWDGGRTWPRSVLVADAFADYSSLVRGPLLKQPAVEDSSITRISSGGTSDDDDNIKDRAAAAPLYGGVLWGSCRNPVPFRLWCIPVEALQTTWWNVLFTRFPLPTSPPSHTTL